MLKDHLHIKLLINKTLTNLFFTRLLENGLN